jgi:alkyl sulfatase BDS1-like metallo-beta-lactamase superfamily hydrolase
MIATKAGDAGMPYTPKDATPATVKANRDAVARYAMEDRQDFTDADRGFIAGSRARSWARTARSSLTSPIMSTSPTMPACRTR